MRWQWIIADSFGRRWRLWLARGPGAEDGGMAASDARRAIGSLAYASLGAGVDGHDRVAAVLVEIHNELSGTSLSAHAWRGADARDARRLSELVSESLESAIRWGRLRIEPATERPPFVVPDDAPETVRDLAPPPRSREPSVPADWVGILVRDVDGQPLANVRCRVSTPGRPARDAATDGDGRVLLRGIESGSCAIELPDVDGREWDGQAAGGA